MESWRCDSGENGFLSEELHTSGDPLAGSKHSSFAWDSRNPSNFSSNLFSTHQQIQNQGFWGLGSLEMVGRQALDSSIFDALSSKADNGRIMNPVMSSSTPFHRDELISKLSATVTESNSRDSSLIDLKLGRFADQWDAHSNKLSKENRLFSTSESSTPSKRVRASPVTSQPAFCQVLGCNKDLSSSKDYHKRHKVCDIHSKTAKVIVNGIEQRFCQQCSRFHLLDAFDDGKRSCRKRLAGHNERRRKPQVGINSGRSGRLLPSYSGIVGSRFLGGGTSFTCQEILSSDLFLPYKYISNEWGRQIKVQGKHDNPLSTIPATDGHLHSKTFFPHCDVETQFLPFTNGGTILNEAGSHYPSIGGLNSSSQSLCHSASLGSEDFDVFDAASTVRSLPRISDTGCALSLLSAQSRNSSRHSSGMPMARPWLVPIGQTYYNVNQVSEKLMGVSSSQASTSGVSNKISSSVEGCQLGPILTSDSSDTVNFEIVDGVFNGSSLSNGKDWLSPETGPTINLLQLSSQLQRVEHQRKSMQLKPENNAVCCLRIT